MMTLAVVATKLAATSYHDIDTQEISMQATLGLDI